ncbi:MAG: hypothetical protein JNM40_13935 [Myxococcales bacterium]|nr:hypothetical protein [Myxococcales bacterium]
MGTGALGQVAGTAQDAAHLTKAERKAAKAERRLSHAQSTSGGSAPVLKGQEGVRASKLRAEQQGKKVRGEEVTFDTVEGRRRVDLLLADEQGNLEAVEVKTGKSKYTRTQQAKDQALAGEGGIPIGENARKAGLYEKVRIPTRLDRSDQ